MPAKGLTQEENLQGRKPEISNVHLEIAGDISRDEIFSQMMTHETPWSVWIFLNENIYSGLGAPRRLFDPLVFYNDILHLKSYFLDQGYFEAIIDTATVFSHDGKYVDVNLNIDLRRRSLVDSFMVDGLSSLGGLQAELMKESFLKQGMKFDKELVAAEQSRILHILSANGYPKAKADSVSLKRFASTNNVSVYMKFTPGSQFKFGTFHLPQDETAVDPDIVFHQLDFAEGDIYSEEKRITSEQNLNRLGLFENAAIRPQFLQFETDSLVYVPIQIFYRTSELQEITPEILMLSENNEFLSTGIGLGYKHRNFLGGARNFSITGHGRVNQIDRLDFIRFLDKGLSEPSLYTKADIQSQWIFPYFFSNKTKASITATLEAEKQPLYRLQTLRGQIGFSTKLATYTLGNTEFNIERVDPKFTNAEFLKVEDTTKQFNFIEAFTLQRDKTNNIFSPTSGFFHSATIEEAGLVSKAVGGFQLPYAEYYKFSFLAKHYFSNDEDQSRVFAVKLRGGFAQLYDKKNSTPVPLPRRFFMGGSGSVRAWRDKRLAAFGDSIIGGTVALEGSFESRIQLFPNRGNFWVFHLQNFWSVVFIDYGNVWNKMSDMKLNEVAVAIGTGLRYESFVGPVRFDIAWRLFDPKKPHGQQWLYEQQFFKNSHAIVHFGIGHAF